MKKRTAKRFPIALIVIYLLTAISILLYVIFTKSPAFSDWFNAGIAHALRLSLATVTSLLPFSLTELLILLLPLWLALLILLANRYSHSMRDALTYVGILLGGICVVAILFVWCFASGYYGTPLAQKLSLGRIGVTAEELERTAAILTEELNALSGEILFSESGASEMPYSLREMNRKLLECYDRLEEKYSFIKSFESRVKPIMLSEPMSYTHITGVYTFFTGEANLNVNFPDYTLPFTAAHELAHQRGIAREDEANFIAFLVCMESDDPYIRYSGLLNLYDYVISALASADTERFLQSYQALGADVRGERIAYSRFFDKYRDNVIADISNATNDLYLQSQGAAEGARSYGMVVELAVAYYKAP